MGVLELPESLPDDFLEELVDVLELLELEELEELAGFPFFFFFATLTLHPTIPRAVTIRRGFAAEITMIRGLFFRSTHTRIPAPNLCS